MQKVVLIVLLLAICSGCADTKQIGGVEYDTYGLINQSEKRNPAIKYRLVTGNVVWGVILCGTIVAPIYFFGFSLYEPTGKTDPNAPKGSV